jgi:mannose-6-phosphate isomerase-like protein (cupin superfamily)
VAKNVKVVKLSEATPDLDHEWKIKDRLPMRSGARGTSKLFSADVADECEVVYQRYAAGYLGPYHVHHHAENVWVVMEGEMEAIIGGVRYFVKAGEAIFMPADVPHTTGNRGPGDMLAVEFYAPSVDRWNPRDSIPVDPPAEIRDAIVS